METVIDTNRNYKCSTLSTSSVIESEDSEWTNPFEEVKISKSISSTQRKPQIAKSKPKGVKRKAKAVRKEKKKTPVKKRTTKNSRRAARNAKF